jgi:hypothetical protein
MKSFTFSFYTIAMPISIIVHRINTEKYIGIQMDEDFSLHLGAKYEIL